MLSQYGSSSVAKESNATARGMNNKTINRM
jgi:hypothetical protein